MAYFTNDTAPFRPFAAIEGIVSRVGDVLASIGEARARKDKVDFLYSKTDDELAAMGLKRDDIVRHVFIDRYYVV